MAQGKIELKIFLNSNVPHASFYGEEFEALLHLHVFPFLFCTESCRHVLQSKITHHPEPAPHFAV